MKMFEQIIDEAGQETGWNQDTKYALLLDFLEAHCPEKKESFSVVMDSLVADEMDTKSPI